MNIEYSLAIIFNIQVINLMAVYYSTMKSIKPASFNPVAFKAKYLVAPQFPWTRKLRASFQRGPSLGVLLENCNLF